MCNKCKRSQEEGGGTASQRRASYSCALSSTRPPRARPPDASTFLPCPPRPVPHACPLPLPASHVPARACATSASACRATRSSPVPTQPSSHAPHPPTHQLDLRRGFRQRLRPKQVAVVRRRLRRPHLPGPRRLHPNPAAELRGNALADQALEGRAGGQLVLLHVLGPRLLVQGVQRALPLHVNQLLRSRQLNAEAVNICGRLLRLRGHFFVVWMAGGFGGPSELTAVLDSGSSSTNVCNYQC